uniref:Uncharacterized protein n=1 Tax=Steinernema glaseri TaxID=37863 RepID=A0A1I7ZZU0_9BILA
MPKKKASELGRAPSVNSGVRQRLGLMPFKALISTRATLTPFSGVDIHWSNGGQTKTSTMNRHHTYH